MQKDESQVRVALRMQVPWDLPKSWWQVDTYSRNRAGVPGGGAEFYKFYLEHEVKETLSWQQGYKCICAKGNRRSLDRQTGSF